MLKRIFQNTVFLLWIIHALPVAAHRVSSVSLISYLDTKQATYVLDAAMEVVPSEEQELNDQISPEDAARQFAEDYLVVMFDRKDQKPEIEIRIEDTSDADTPPELRRQQVLTKLSGKIPAGASEFLLYLDPSCPMAVVMVVIKDETPSRRMQVVLAGEYSRPVSVAPITEGDPFSAESGVAVAPSAPSDAGSNVEAKPDPGGGYGPFIAGWRASLFDGLLPVLFVAGMLLLTLERRAVLFQVAAILVGMSLAISLVARGYLPGPEWSPIAFKLLFAGVAAEALFHDRLCWWRLPLVAGAGVGAGFEIALTSSLQGIFRPSGSGTGEVIRFLLGVETALVLVVLVAGSLLLAASRFEWYRRALIHPLAVLLISVGLYGVIEPFL